jgi:hypothetical protein
MPFLSWAQRRTGRALGSNAVVADSAQTLRCTYLSAVLLVGLVLNATVGWHWADPIAGLIVAAVAVKEGREAWRGEGCCGAIGASHPGQRSAYSNDVCVDCCCATTEQDNAHTPEGRTAFGSPGAVISVMVGQTRRPLLAAMARDLENPGTLRLTTVSAMWAANVAHLALTNPGAAEAVDEEPADHRPDHGRGPDDRAEVAPVAAALARREEVGYHGEGEHRQPTTTETLDRAETDQRGHVLTQPAQHPPRQEGHDRRLQDDLASVEAAEFSYAGRPRSGPAQSW